MATRIVEEKLCADFIVGVPYGGTLLSAVKIFRNAVSIKS